MAYGTSPVGGPNGTAWYQVNYGNLYHYYQNSGHDTGIPMVPGSSPTLGPDGKVWFGFFADGYVPYCLARCDNQGNNFESWTSSIAEGTSPAVDANSNAYFQGGNGHLWYYAAGSGDIEDFGQGMAAGTSPSVGYDRTVYFNNSNDNTLWKHSGYQSTVGVFADNSNIGQAMYPGASPAENMYLH